MPRSVLLTVLACVAALPGCGEDELLRVQPDTDDITCYRLAQKLCDLGWGAGDSDEACTELVGEELYCDLLCDYPATTKQCIMSASGDRALERCFDAFEESLFGGVSSSCTELCQKCDACAAAHPTFERDGCLPPDVSLDECASWCEASAPPPGWEETLSSLSKPIADYSCCELSVLM